MILHILLYIAVGILVVFCLKKALRFARMPIHVRWELYPVPHEKGKEYGGSYFEEVDWWTKPRKKDLVGQIKFIVPEIIFLRALYHENKPLWRSSFPFHLGLYLYVASIALVFGGTVVALVIGDGGLTNLINYLAVVLGVAAFVSGAFGALGLLYLRLTDAKLKPYTAFKDHFNLVLILALFVTGFLTWIGDDSMRLAPFYAVMTGLLRFEAVEAGGAVTGHVLILAFFMAYFPFTHMTHAFTKYFTWEKVRFADEPNLPGSEVEARVRQVLSYPVTWSAPHIDGRGRSWAEVATSTGREDEQAMEEK